jgi:hypothetical protein
VAVLRGYQAEIIGEVDPLVAGLSALDLNIRQNREDAGEAVAGQIERAQAPKDVGAVQQGSCGYLAMLRAEKRGRWY